MAAPGCHDPLHLDVLPLPWFRAQASVISILSLLSLLPLGFIVCCLGSGISPGLSLITEVREHSRCAFLRPVRIELQAVGRLVLGKIEGSEFRVERTGHVF